MKICVLFVVVCYLKLYRCIPVKDGPSLTAVIRERLEEDRIQDAQEKIAESDESLKTDALASVDAMARRDRRSLFNTPTKLNEVDGPLFEEQHKITKVITKSPFRVTTLYQDITTISTPPTSSMPLTSTELPTNNALPIWLQILRLFMEPLFHSEEATEVTTDLNATEEPTIATTELPTTATTEFPKITTEFPTIGYERTSEASSSEKPHIFVQLIRMIAGPWLELETEPSTSIPDLSEENTIVTTSSSVVETTSFPNPSEYSEKQDLGILARTEPTLIQNTEPGTLMENNDAMMNPIEPQQQQWNPFLVPHLFYFPPRLGFAGTSF